MTYSTKKSEINAYLGLTFSNFCAIILPVSERNNMNNEIEIQRYPRDPRERLHFLGATAPVVMKRDTFTLNGNTYEVSHDPTHQADQLAGYCGNNPK